MTLLDSAHVRLYYRLGARIELLAIEARISEDAARAMVADITPRKLTDGPNRRTVTRYPYGTVAMVPSVEGVPEYIATTLIGVTLRQRYASSNEARNALISALPPGERIKHGLLPVFGASEPHPTEWRLSRASHGSWRIRRNYCGVLQEQTIANSRDMTEEEARVAAAKLLSEAV